jgi:hypothetical protein
MHICRHREPDSFSHRTTSAAHSAAAHLDLHECAQLLDVAQRGALLHPVANLGGETQQQQQPQRLRRI